MSGRLTHSPSEIVQRLLIDEGVASDVLTKAPWPVYESRFPDSPDNAIVVYHTEGVTHGRVHSTGETQEHYGIQIKLRNSLSTNGKNKIEEVGRLLDELFRAHVFISGSSYLVQAITRVGSILPLGLESPQSTRRLYSINALAAIVEEDGTGT